MLTTNSLARNVILGSSVVLSLADTSFAQENDPALPAAVQKADPLDELLQGISWDLVLGLVGAGLAAGCGYGFTRLVQAAREKVERTDLQFGDRMNTDSRFQEHTLQTLPDGSRALLFRPVPPAEPWEEVLKSCVLAREVRAGALLTSAENPSLKVSADFQRALFTELRNTISVSNRAVPGEQKEFLVFLTCEDSKNTIKHFQTAIRGFLVTPEDLRYFSDLDNVRNTKVEAQYFGYRLLALHYLAQKVESGELKEGQDFARMSLPSRGDDKPLSSLASVDWDDIYREYHEKLQVTPALRALVTDVEQKDEAQGG